MIRWRPVAPETPLAFKFDAALSYVSSDRALAQRLSSALGARGFDVFFDREDVETIVGRDGAEALADVYTRQSRICVLLLTPAYERSPWTHIEREAMLARRTTDRTAFLVPVRVEGAPPPWLPPQLLYFDLTRQSEDELIDVLVKRIARVAGTRRAVPERLGSAAVGIGTLKNEILADGEWLYVPSAGSDYNQPDARDGVLCLRADDLSEVWHARTRHDANALAAQGGLLYVGTDAGTIECIDAATGDARWPNPPQLASAVLARPTLTPAGLLVCAVDGDAAILDPETGAITERTRLDGGLVGDPLVMDDRLLVATQSGWIIESPLGDPLRGARESESRDVRRLQVSRAGFDHDQPCWFTASPVRLEGTIFIPHSRETTLPGLPIAALERRRFQIRYTIAELDRAGEDFGNIRARPVVIDGLAIVPAAYSNLTVALDRDGGIVWAEPCGWPAFPQYGSPAGYGSDVLVPRFDGALHAVSARDGKRRWSIALGMRGHEGQVFYAHDALPGQDADAWWEAADRVPINAPVTVVGDVAYLVDAEGTLHAVGLPTP